MLPLLRSKAMGCSVRTKVIYSSSFKPVRYINGRNYCEKPNNSNGQTAKNNNKPNAEQTNKQSEPTQEPIKETKNEGGEGVNETQEPPKETKKEGEPEIYRDEVEVEMAQDAHIEILRKQVNDVKYNWRLTLADLDNLTKKAHKDTALAREAGAEKIIKKLFPVMDNIDYCLKYKPDFSSPEFADNLEARGAFDGLESAKKQFCNALVSYDVSEIFPMLGDVFDPLVHEAIFQIEQPADENIKPGQIGEIIKAGWIKKGILLRPASVAVVKVPEIPIPVNFQREEGDNSVMEEDDSEDGSDIELEEKEKKEKQNINKE
jgi:molecular chaperone GrpE